LEPTWDSGWGIRLSRLNGRPGYYKGAMECVATVVPNKHSMW